jgi:isocitrate lyase
MEEAIERGKRYADAGADMVWPEFPTPDRKDAELFAEAMDKDFPGLPLGFNYSSSFKWTEAENPVTFKELSRMGYKFIFVSMGAVHAAMYAEWNFLKDLSENQEQAQLRLQALKSGHPTENHHVMGKFEHFRQLEEEYLPGEMVQERYSATQGFGARGFHARDVL